MGEIGLQDGKRGGIGHVRPRVQGLDADAWGWYRCLGCRVSDVVAGSSGEKQIS